MMSKNEKALKKLQSIVKPDPGTWKKDAQWRHENKTWIRKSQKIAFKILRALRDQKKTQKDLAAIMNVSPQQVNKWVKGKENFTLETLSRLEEALDINLLAIDYKDNTNLGLQKQGVSVFPVVSGIQNSIIQSSVQAYIDSKKPENRWNMYFSNNMHSVFHFHSLSKKEFELGKGVDILSGEELSDNLTLFEIKGDSSKLIELNPKSTYKKKITHNDLLVAEPNEDYY